MRPVVFVILRKSKKTKKQMRRREYWCFKRKALMTTWDEIFLLLRVIIEEGHL